MGLREDFKKAIAESIRYKDHLEIGRDNYYSSSYAERIKAYFDREGVLSLETEYSPRYKCVSICAFASSARLAYLYFLSQEATHGKPVFEKLIENDIPSSDAPTHMDVVRNGIYYECKCQEILSANKTPFSSSYLRSPLFQEFAISDSFVVSKKHYRNGKSFVSHVLEFPVSQLGISLPHDPSYHEMHFDVKQLISHLIAIANTKGEESVSLVYTLFKPSKASIDKYPSLQKLYASLDEEWSAIFAKGTAIDAFITRHNIIVSREEIDIASIEDFNYEQTYL